MPINKIHGGGPWAFQIGALNAGEMELLDFHGMTYNGTNGWFRKVLPLDSITVTNESSQTVKVELDGIYEFLVRANSTETFTRGSFERARIINQGASAIAADSVTVEVVKDPYDADDRAQEQKQKPTLQKAAESVLPGAIGFLG